jgi:hypothetical protein
MSDEKKVLFNRFPKRFYECGYSLKSFVVWCYLVDQKPGFYPSVARICQHLKISSPKTVRRCLIELEENGLINVVRTTGKRNQFVITDLGKILPRVKTTPGRKYPRGGVENTQDLGKKNPPTWVKTTPPIENKRIENKHREYIIENTPKPKSAGKPAAPLFENQDLEFAISWISWLKERESHHAKSAGKNKYAVALYKLRTKYGLDSTRLPEIKKLCLESDFWASNVVSPNGLLKRWKNGTVCINSLLDELKRVKNKTPYKKTPRENMSRFDTQENIDKILGMGCDGTETDIDVIINAAPTPGKNVPEIVNKDYPVGPGYLESLGLIDMNKPRPVPKEPEKPKPPKTVPMKWQVKGDK